MRRKASEPGYGMACRAFYDIFPCRKPSHVERYISDGMANTNVETNMTDEGYGGQSKEL